MSPNLVLRHTMYLPCPSLKLCPALLCLFAWLSGRDCGNTCKVGNESFVNAKSARNDLRLLTSVGAVTLFGCLSCLSYLSYAKLSSVGQGEWCVCDSRFSVRDYAAFHI